MGDKTRPVRLTEKTGVVPNLGSKRSFFGTTGSERVYSKEPPEIIEKPATIKSRSKFDKTSDLQEIPTILAVEELEHTRILGQNPPTPRQEEPETEAVEESAQIRLEGFDDQIENVPNIDENVAERILEERRRDKVNKFRLFAPEEGQAQEGRGALSRVIFATQTSAPPFWNACLPKRPLCRPVLYLPCCPGGCCSS